MTPPLRFFVAVFLAVLTLLGVETVAANDDVESEPRGYRSPPVELGRAALASRPLGLGVDPTGRWLLVAEENVLPPVAHLAWPTIEFGRLRFYPRAAARIDALEYAGLSLCALDGEGCREIVGLPSAPRLRHVAWSLDGRWIVFAHLRRDALELWRVDVEAARAERISVDLHGLFGEPCAPLVDSRWLCRARGDDASVESIEPVESMSRASRPAPVIRDPRVEGARSTGPRLDKRHLLSRLVTVDLESGRVEPLAGEAFAESLLVRRVEPSPDGRWLLVETLAPPGLEVRSIDGETVHPLAPPGRRPAVRTRDAVAPGSRRVAWRPGVDGALVWTEALDAGDPRREVEERDALRQWAAPFDRPPETLTTVEGRVADIVFAAEGDLALVVEQWWSTARERLWAVSLPGDLSSAKRPRLLAESVPGTPAGAPIVPLRREVAGGEVLDRSADGRIRVRGHERVGETAEPRPLFGLLDPELGTVEALWRSPLDAYERPVAVLDRGEASGRLLTVRESPSEPPHFRAHSLDPEEKQRRASRRVTPVPTDPLAGTTTRRLRYVRADGVALEADLHLPAGEGPLPLLFAAYPESFADRDEAAAAGRSSRRFPRLEALAPRLWTARGYAVIEPEIPVLDADRPLEELLAGTRAALDAAFATGAIDRERVATIGHSYGATLVALLLAHTDDFRAGIASSGAYNRTLTPFGFQDESRSLWSASEIYESLSPFRVADAIDEPLLLVHGAADANPATPSEQSERLYEALRFLGTPTRLVLLPEEGHVLRGRESVLHFLWEVDTWLATHLAEPAIRDR